MTARRNTELGAFLRTRRARLNPDSVGLAVGGRRRVPGLRREEVAGLAGVSPDYYARLEQGRQVTASSSVLNALAHTLRLSAEERLHLYTLAGEGAPVSAALSTPLGPADDRVRLALEALGDTPAIVYGPFVDIITANRAARFLFADFDTLPPLERNAVGWMLLSPAARELYRDQWDAGARDLIGMLRIDVGRLPGDPRGEQVVGELSAASPYFRQLWNEYEVSSWRTEEKVLYHPAAGPLRFRNSGISVKGVPGQEISLIIPEDPQAFRAALAAWDQDQKAGQGRSAVSTISP
jgi:transcriptional regulator with XRE-family HTH domain